jgi:hypothetical protein
MEAYGRCKTNRNYSRIYLGDWERPSEIFVVTTDILEQDFPNKKHTA